MARHERRSERERECDRRCEERGRGCTSKVLSAAVDPDVGSHDLVIGLWQFQVAAENALVRRSGVGEHGIHRWKIVLR